jgi:hypothetical protein
VRLGLLIAASATAVVACGGGAPAPAPEPTSTAVPALARAPKHAGEILIRGDVSPASHGPYDLRGVYTVRFQQYAPEDPKTDFTNATSFVAALDRRPEITGRDSVALFKASRRTQTRRLRIDGRFYVDVSFGDYPYVIRITPRD